MMNVGNPDLHLTLPACQMKVSALRVWEFIINRMIGLCTRAYCSSLISRLPELQAEIRSMMRVDDPVEFLYRSSG